MFSKTGVFQPLRSVYRSHVPLKDLVVKIQIHIYKIMFNYILLYIEYGMFIQIINTYVIRRGLVAHSCMAVLRAVSANFQHLLSKYILYVKILLSSNLYYTEVEYNIK